jgi:hypothetical protein
LRNINTRTRGLAFANVKTGDDSGDDGGDGGGDNVKKDKKKRKTEKADPNLPRPNPSPRMIMHVVFGWEKRKSNCNYDLKAFEKNETEYCVLV